MTARKMSAAPIAVDETGGYYPVVPLDRPNLLALAAEGVVPPPAATHYTFDEATNEIVDWLREVVAKSSRGRPNADPAIEAFFPSASLEQDRRAYPGMGFYVQSVYAVIEQVAP